MFEYEIKGTPYTLKFWVEKREGYEGNDPFEGRKITFIEILEYTGKVSTERVGTLKLNELRDGITFELNGKKVTQIR